VNENTGEVRSREIEGEGREREGGTKMTKMSGFFLMWREGEERSVSISSSLPLNRNWKGGGGGKGKGGGNYQVDVYD